jgi:DSF synthase
MNAVLKLPQGVNNDFEQVRTRFDEEYGVVWLYMRPEPRPCFTRKLLDEGHYIAHHPYHGLQGTVLDKGVEKPSNYVVVASDVPGVFNLGGDLATFQHAIRSRNRDELIRYARISVELSWAFYSQQSQVTTISLVQGLALGGGFESALSTNIMVAEKSAKMGLPEVLFNLFPGMGALSYLSRKIGMQAADAMVRSGKTYTAIELHEMGVVDVLAEDGAGENAVYEWIRKNHRSMNSFQAIQHAKQRVNPLSLEELYEIGEIWVNAALRLTERDLRLMERLVRAQDEKKCWKPIEPTQPAANALAA